MNKPVFFYHHVTDQDQAGNEHRESRHANRGMEEQVVEKEPKESAHQARRCSAEEGHDRTVFVR